MVVLRQGKNAPGAERTHSGYVYVARAAPARDFEELSGYCFPGREVVQSRRKTIGWLDADHHARGSIIRCAAFNALARSGIAEREIRSAMKYVFLPVPARNSQTLLSTATGTISLQISQASKVSLQIIPVLLTQDSDLSISGRRRLFKLKQ